MKFTFCENNNIEDAINFCNKNGFTPRSKVKWINDSIEAILAVDNNKIYACFPYQKKKIITTKGIKNLGHFTSLSVDKSLRGRGLGTELIKFLHTKTNLDGFMVNSIKNDKASNWYKKNGYLVLGNCEVFYKRPNDNNIKNILDINNAKQIMKIELMEEKLVKSFNKFNIGYVGFEKRDLGFWIKKLENHYYSDTSEYFIIKTEIASDSYDYCLFAISNRNKDTKTIDTLEFIYSKESSIVLFLRTLQNLSRELNISKVRIQCSNDNFLKNYLLRDGFIKDFDYEILSYLKNDKIEVLNPLKFYQFDYI